MVASEPIATVPAFIDLMVTDPLNQPQPAALSASKLPLLLRAVADPEGKGEISPKRAATIQQIETNLARHREAGQSRRTKATTAKRFTSANQVG